MAGYQSPAPRAAHDQKSRWTGSISSGRQTCENKGTGHVRLEFAMESDNFEGHEETI